MIGSFGPTSSMLAWDFANDVVETRHFCERFTEAKELIVEVFKKDRAGDSIEWSHPIIYLDIM